MERLTDTKATTISEQDKNILLQPPIKASVN